MVKVLITGSKGFIGTHLYEALRKMPGVEVEGWDLKDGKDINHLTPHDLNDGSRKVQYIFHLAAFPKVPFSVERPGFTNWHNLNGTIRVLWAAQKAGVKRMIFASSSAVYGNSESLLKTEAVTPTIPMSPYAIQKLAGEHYCRIFSELYGLETISLRYFNVYGEDMPIEGYSAAIATFLDQKKRGKPLTVFGGRQTRDFVYVGDVVKANIKAMELKENPKGIVVNIGSGKDYAIEDVAKMIGGKIEYLPQREGEPMGTKAYLSRAKTLLNWKPSVKLEDWLK